MHQDGHERRRDPHGPRRLLVGETGQMAERERPFVARVETVQGRSEFGQLVGIVDAVDVVDRDMVVESIRRPSGPVAPSSTLTAVVVGEQVPGDAEEPGCDPARMPAKPVETLEGPLERGRREVLGEFAIATAAVDEAVDRIDVTTVELGEGIGIGTGPLHEELLVAPVAIVIGIHHPPG